MKKSNRPQMLFLIERGPQPPFHNAPYSQVIICTQRHTAKWEAGDSNRRATVWDHAAGEPGGGWLLGRYKGFDVDYGGVVKRIELWDGTEAAFCHDKTKAPWTLLTGAVWWSWHEMPEWLKALGVVYPSDDWTKEVIRQDLGTCTLPYSQRKRLETRRNEDDFPSFLAPGQPA